MTVTLGGSVVPGKRYSILSGSEMVEYNDDETKGKKDHPRNLSVLVPLSIPRGLTSARFASGRWVGCTMSAVLSCKIWHCT